jgi:hypothetical protein
MRTVLKRRIFKRFMDGQSTVGISMDLLIRSKKKTITYDDIPSMRIEVEQAIRDCVNEIESRER